MLHDLKCWPEQFAAIRSGTKTCELRRDDRGGFAIGDLLRLREWMPGGLPPYFTGRVCVVEVTHVQRGFGLGAGYVALSILRPATQHVLVTGCAEKCLDGVYVLGVDWVKAEADSAIARRAEKCASSMLRDALDRNGIPDRLLPDDTEIEHLCRRVVVALDSLVMKERLARDQRTAVCAERDYYKHRLDKATSDAQKKPPASAPWECFPGSPASEFNRGLHEGRLQLARETLAEIAKLTGAVPHAGQNYASLINAYAVRVRLDTKAEEYSRRLAEAKAAVAQLEANLPPALGLGVLDGR